CAKNPVDAEIMRGTLLEHGVEVTNDPGQADVMIVNTCSFIDSAQEESVDAILESAEVREARNRGQGLIVSGCLPQRFRDEVPKLFPEVDAFMGIDQVTQVTDIVRQALARRAKRIGKKHPTSNIQHPTSNEKIVRRIAELDERRTGNKHEKSESLRGSEKFGNTKTILTHHASRFTKPHPASRIPHPASSARVGVNVRPQAIPDYATPRFRPTPRHVPAAHIGEGCNQP